MQSPPNHHPEGLRVLAFSHDSFGLGHLRRTLTIASAITETIEGSNVMVVTGSPCATQFRTPDRVELVKLPAATKDAEGNYTPRTLPHDLMRLVDMRSRITLELFRAYQPHVCIVDHQPLGLAGELREMLLLARRQGCRTILGMRDIIDHPDAVARDWGRPEIRAALRHYERLCIYGSPTVFDARSEYHFPPELANRSEFTGYVLRPMRSPGFRPVPDVKPTVLVTTGGGEDGAGLLETYLESLEQEPQPWQSVLVLGPLLDGQTARSLKRRARQLDDVRVHTFYEDMPRLYAESSAVVSMAGYNSVVEILAHRLPAVLVPRTFPRREQLIRAERLAAAGLAQCLPDPSPEQLANAVAKSLERGPTTQDIPPVDGAEGVARVVQELFSQSRGTTPAKVVQ